MYGGTKKLKVRKKGVENMKVCKVWKVWLYPVWDMQQKCTKMGEYKIQHYLLGIWLSLFQRFAQIEVQSKGSWSGHRPMLG